MYLHRLFQFTITLLLVIECVTCYDPDTCIQCRKSHMCNPPQCFCCRDTMPLERNVIPQMVFFTFDDAVTPPVANHYRELFDSKRKNPNGCPISMTLFVSHKSTVYSLVREFYEKGMEIGSHSVTHNHMSKSTFFREAKAQKENIAKNAKIPENEIIGWRSPFLEPIGDTQPATLKDLGYEYDATLTITKKSPDDLAITPFTLDHGWPYDCKIKPCPANTHKGFWEVPVVSVKDYLNKYDCVYIDGCNIPPPSENMAYKFLWDNFQRYYTTNRAPMGINMHASWFYYPDRKAAMDRFIKELVKLDDVYIVSVKQVIEWLKHPTPLNQLQTFAPWSCNGVNKTVSTAGIFKSANKPQAGGNHISTTKNEKRRKTVNGSGKTAQLQRAQTRNLNFKRQTANTNEMQNNNIQFNQRTRRPMLPTQRQVVPQVPQTPSAWQQQYDMMAMPRPFTAPPMAPNMPMVNFWWQQPATMMQRDLERRRNFQMQQEAIRQKRLQEERMFAEQQARIAAEKQARAAAEEKERLAEFQRQEEIKRKEALRKQELEKQGKIEEERKEQIRQQELLKKQALEKQAQQKLADEHMKKNDLRRQALIQQERERLREMHNKRNELLKQKESAQLHNKQGQNMMPKTPSKQEIMENKRLEALRRKEQLKKQDEERRRIEEIKRKELFKKQQVGLKHFDNGKQESLSTKQQLGNMQLREQELVKIRAMEKHQMKMIEQQQYLNQPGAQSTSLSNHEIKSSLPLFTQRKSNEMIQGFGDNNDKNKNSITNNPDNLSNNMQDMNNEVISHKSKENTNKILNVSGQLKNILRRGKSERIRALEQLSLSQLQSLQTELHGLLLNQDKTSVNKNKLKPTKKLIKSMIAIPASKRLVSNQDSSMTLLDEMSPYQQNFENTAASFKNQYANLNKEVSSIDKWGTKISSNEILSMKLSEFHDTNPTIVSEISSSSSSKQIVDSTEPSVKQTNAQTTTRPSSTTTVTVPTTTIDLKTSPPATTPAQKIASKPMWKLDNFAFAGLQGPWAISVSTKKPGISTTVQRDIPKQTSPNSFKIYKLDEMKYSKPLFSNEASHPTLFGNTLKQDSKPKDDKMDLKQSSVNLPVYTKDSVRQSALLNLNDDNNALNNTSKTVTISPSLNIKKISTETKVTQNNLKTLPTTTRQPSAKKSLDVAKVLNIKNKISNSTLMSTPKKINRIQRLPRVTSFFRRGFTIPPIGTKNIPVISKNKPVRRIPSYIPTVNKPLSSGSRCVQGTNCVLPQCSCKTDSPPADLSPSQVPQIVFISIDGSLNFHAYSKISNLFSKTRVNPNGCRIKGTVFVTDAGSSYRIADVLHSEGLEIAMMGLSSRPVTSVSALEETIVKQKGRISRGLNMEQNVIKGWRSPGFKLLGDEQFDILSNHSFYDSSIVIDRTSKNQQKLWPFSLDFGLNEICENGNCPSSRHAGVWEVPIIPFVGPDNTTACQYTDGCTKQPASAQETFDFLMDNFNYYYKTNKAPFAIRLKQIWFHWYYRDNFAGLLKFIDTILSHGDVYVTSVSDMLEYVRNPVPLKDLSNFGNWKC